MAFGTNFSSATHASVCGIIGGSSQLCAYLNVREIHYCFISDEEKKNHKHRCHHYGHV